MSLDEKIEKAKHIVAKHLTATTVLYCSFGKDSMVMLHLIRSMGLNLPVIYNHIPYFPVKQAFANKVIEEWGLVVHRFPPFKTEVVMEPFDIINRYSLPDDNTLVMPVGVTPPIEGEPFLCGLMDLLGTLKSVVAYPWNVALIGHKSSDSDPLFGDMPLVANSCRLSPNMTAVFPIGDFTDADIWEYTERFNVPYNDKRYDRASGYKEFADTTHNSDYYPACTKCMQAGPEIVDCPKYGQVPNISSVLPLYNIELGYVEKSNA
jgi:3'-phosphoadenosine 5'-phosphosulfate sulfotransferase (PAPS reductase)/FAD synthetase